MSKFINFTSHTDIGLKRQANEDNYGTQSTVNGEVFIVCDGMGGHVGGATASKIAVESIASYLNTEYYENIFIALGKAVEFANAQVFGEAQSNPELKGMGTTCTVLIVREHKVYIAHVGDSRIYIQNDGKLKRLTKDHSFVQGLVDKGIIRDSEAEEHPRKNELLQALGVRPEVEVTVAQEAIEPKQGDKFMLCSDGLCGLVNDTDMNQVIQRSPYLETAAKDLIDLAKAAGGNDNITVQLVEVLESPFLESRFIDLSPSEAAPSVINANRTTAIEDRRGRSSQNKKSSRSKTILIGVVSLLITGLSIGGFFFFMNSGVDDKAKQEEVTTKPGESSGGLEDGEDKTSNNEGDSYVEIDYRYKVVIDENAANDKRCTLINVNDPEDKKFITEGFSLKWEKLCSALGLQIQESDGKALCSEGCFILGANGRYQPLCEYFRNNGNKKSLKSIDKIFITEAAWADENQNSCCTKERSTVVIERRTSGDGTSTSGSTT
ncbi:MAG: Stp1/IreP family PP2C-type Ser/Thr phosphatase, partial [Chitinophagales bacterium]